MSNISKEIKLWFIVFLFMFPFYASNKNLTTKANAILHYRFYNTKDDDNQYSIDS